ncbi:MAG TPA: hypothetical protein VML75_28730 [Kofleriaceae bacterium]|nr:hypothetical protein [Kofleriaceae bacterium]
MTHVLGTALADATVPISLPVAALARHVVALGASGAGEIVGQPVDWA